MSGLSYWHDEAKSVYVYQFENDWTVNEFYRTIQDSCREIRKQEGLVDVIVDFSNGASFPSNILSAVNDLLERAPEQIGQIVIISGGFASVSDMANLFVRMYSQSGEKLWLSASVDMAIMMIEAERRLLAI